MPVTVTRRKGESDQQLLKRFRKEVSKSRILSDVRRKRFHLSKGEIKRIKEKKAQRRIRRRQARGRRRGR